MVFRQRRKADFCCIDTLSQKKAYSPEAGKGYLSTACYYVVSNCRKKPVVKTLKPSSGW